MDVQVLSEKTVNWMIKSNELGENTAVICFYSKDTGKPKELMKSGARVLLVPYDDEDFDDLACDDDYEFYFPKPKKVAEFINTAVTDGCEIICEDCYGSSAAYGCAAAILEYYEGRGLDVFASERYIPNKLVYHKVFDALSEICGQKPSSENTVEIAIASRSKMQKLIHSGKLGEELFLCKLGYSTVFSGDLVTLVKEAELIANTACNGKDHDCYHRDSEYGSLLAGLLGSGFP